MRFQVFAFLPVRSYGLPFALQAVREPNKICEGMFDGLVNLRTHPEKKNRGTCAPGEFRVYISLFK